MVHSIAKKVLRNKFLKIHKRKKKLKKIHKRDNNKHMDPQTADIKLCSVSYFGQLNVNGIFSQHF